MSGVCRRYIVVICGPEQVKTVESYLYDHTWTVLETTAPNDKVNKRVALTMVTHAGSDDRAAYLARYQADRLASGLWDARVFDTMSEAGAYVTASLSNLT